MICHLIDFWSALSIDYISLSVVQGGANWQTFKPFWKHSGGMFESLSYLDKNVCAQDDTKTAEQTLNKLGVRMQYTSQERTL